MPERENEKPSERQASQGETAAQTDDDARYARFASDVYEPPSNAGRAKAPENAVTASQSQIFDEREVSPRTGTTAEKTVKSEAEVPKAAEQQKGSELAKQEAVRTIPEGPKQEPARTVPEFVQHEIPPARVESSVNRQGTIGGAPNSPMDSTKTFGTTPQARITPGVIPESLRSSPAFRPEPKIVDKVADEKPKFFAKMPDEKIVAKSAEQKGSSPSVEQKNTARAPEVNSSTARVVPRNESVPGTAKESRLEAGAPRVEGSAGSRIEASTRKSESTTFKVELSAAKIDATGPKPDVSPSKMEASAARIQPTAPKIEAGTPKIEASVSKIEVSAPRTQAAAPKVEASAPKIDAAPSKVEASVPRIQPIAAKIEASVPKVEANAPKVEVSSNKIEASAAKTDTRPQRIEPTSPGVEASAPRIQTGVPRIDSGAPRIETRAPRIETGTPRTEAVVPSLDVGTPKIETRIPRLDGGTARVEPKRYYIPGSEVALAVAIAAFGVSRHRPEVAQPPSEKSITRFAVKGEEQLPTEAPRSPQFKDLTPVPEEELKSTTAPTVDKIFAAPKSMIDAPQQAKSDVPKDADAAPEDATELIDQPIDSDPEVSNKVLTRPTYMVLPRDTLVSIARELFNDERLAWLIVDLNSGSVEQTTMDGKTIVDLKARQVLYLPVWTDIEQFFRRKVNRNPDDLVTIVNESQIDVELRDSVLGKAMGTETKPPNAHTYPDVRVSSDTRFHPEFSMQAMAFLRGFQRRVQFKHSFTD